jgi:hypothetical protein
LEQATAGTRWFVAAAALAALLKRAADDSDVALQLVVQRERVLAAAEKLVAGVDASEQPATFNLKSQLLLMPWCC